MPISQITGSVTGVVLTGATYANPITVTATGKVSGGMSAATRWTIDNYGSISGTSVGVYLQAGGLVTNATSGVIVGQVRVAGVAGTVVNAGSISISGPSASATAISLRAGGSVTNAASGVIRNNNYFGVLIEGGLGTVDNSGIINSGRIGIYMVDGFVTNTASGMINAGTYGVRMLGSLSTVDNYGTINGLEGVVIGIHGINGYAVVGSVINQGSAAIIGWFYGVRAGTIDNRGLIRSSVNGGVYARSVTNESGGTITSTFGDGVVGTGQAFPGADFTAENSGTIVGVSVGVLASGSATVQNAGVITGGQHAVGFRVAGDNRLIVDAGAVFNGTVYAVAGGTNVIELASSAKAGTLSGLGVEYLGFQTVTIDSGAAWNIAGKKAGFNGVSIAGFNTHDTLDLTDLAFAAGDMATLNSATNVLTVRNSGATVLAAVQLSGGFVGYSFSVSGDGATGTDITLGKAGPKSKITGTYTSGITLTAAAYTNPVTVTHTGQIFTNGNGISAATAWTIDNYGGVSGVTDTGIDLAGGGAVTNGAGGSIYGEYAGLVGGYKGGAVALRNLGTVRGLRFGVVLRAGGDVTNGAGGTITSIGDTAVYAVGRRVNSVSNSGSIEGYNVGVFLGVLGGSVTNMSGGSIVGSAKDGILASGPATVLNAGLIAGGKDAVYFDAAGANRLIVDAGAIFHGRVDAIAGGANVIELASSASAGILSGLGSEYLGFQTVAIDAGAAWTVKAKRAGFHGVTIAGFNTHDMLDLTNVAFEAGDTATLNSATDVLTITNAGGTTLARVQLSGNFAGDAFTAAGDGATGTDITLAKPLKKIIGTYTSGITLTSAAYADPITVTATGTIQDLSRVKADMFAATRWTIDNYGSIRGYTADDGIYLAGGGLVTNATSGRITGMYFGIRMRGAAKSGGSAATVVNAGSIHSYVNAGIWLDGGGSVTNQAGGTIKSSESPTHGGLRGVYVDGAPGTVVNAGRIDAYGVSGYGIELIAGGSVTNLAGGFINGGGYGVFALSGGPSSTVENAGTISSGGRYAVRLAASLTNRLIVDAGAVFHGQVRVDAYATNTLELTAKNGAGTLVGLGSEYVGFQRLTFDSGATWTVKGAKAGFVGVTLAGLNTHDVLDLTDLAFATGDKATLNSTTDVLTISTSGGATIDTLQLAGSFAGYAFNVSSDGKSGLDITMRSTGVAVPASGPAAPASTYGQMAQFVQAVAMDRSTLSSFAEPTPAYRPQAGAVDGSLAASLRRF